MLNKHRNWHNLVKHVILWSNRVRRVQVLDLLDPEENGADEFYGLMAEVKKGRQRLFVPLGELELSKKHPYHQ